MKVTSTVVTRALTREGVGVRKGQFQLLTIKFASNVHVVPTYRPIVGVIYQQVTNMPKGQRVMFVWGFLFRVMFLSFLGAIAVWVESVETVLTSGGGDP